MHLLLALAADNSNGAAEMTQGELIAWIAGIATAVATVVTAAMTLWFRMMDKPSPEFDAVPLYHNWSNGSHNPLELPNHTLTLSNVGSGPARIVSFIGVHASVYATFEKKQIPKEHLAIFEVGQTITINTQAIPSRWEDVCILMTWVEDSHLFWWRNYKYKLFKISDLFERPVLTESTTDLNYGTIGSVPIPSDSPLHKQIQQLSTKLEESGTVVLVRSKTYARRKVWRKLSRAGWRWRQHLAKTNPENTD